jgi:putative methyltransferase (TIGR04325 family)
MKQFIKSLIPPILLNTLRKITNNKYGWKGDYSTWQEAQDDSTGYDNDEILQTVKNSLLKVKNGEEVFERDSVIFNEIQYSWPLLAGLMFCSAKIGGALKVCDFGGSLGSTYFQNKKFLDGLDNVSWSVIEQEHFVDIGKKEFEDERLRFFYDIDECAKKESPNILLLSSVLQYIESPYELLDDILKNNFEYVLIDRTSFIKNSEKIKLQIVPPSIYEASYPCRFFDESKFIEYFIKKGYSVFEEFDALDGESEEYKFKGMILEKEHVLKIKTTI